MSLSPLEQLAQRVRKLEALDRGVAPVPGGGSAGDGDVTGPASSTNQAIVRFNGLTGKLIQNSVVTIDNTGALIDPSTIQCTQLLSTVLTGTAPFTVASTTLVSNLNADLLDGHHASDFALAGSGLTGTGTNGRITQWTGASTLGDSTLLKTGAALLTLKSDNLSAEWYVRGSTGYQHFMLEHGIACTCITLSETDSATTLSWDESKAFNLHGGGEIHLGGFDLTVPVTGTAAIGAGTLTSATTNDVSLSAHTHAITLSPSLLGNASAQYHTLISGAIPFAYAESGFMLDGTTGGKTILAVTNTKTLTLTATDNYGLTIGANSSIAGTAIVGTPGTLTVATTNAAADPHTHAITSSNNPGAAASLLASNAAGSLKLRTLSVRSGDITDGYASALRITGTAGDTLPLVVLDGVTNQKGLQIIASGGASADIRGGTGIAISASATSGTVLSFDSGAGTVLAGAAETGMFLNYTMSLGNPIAANLVSFMGIRTSGTPTAGFGGYCIYRLTSSTTPDQYATKWHWEWADPTDATRKARARWVIYDTVEREGFRIEASGSAPMIGFLGANAVVQQVGDIFPALVNFGLLSAPIIPYGHMYADDIAQVITVSVVSTEYKVTAGLSGGLCSAEFTFQNGSELKCNKAGTYLVSWGMSVSSGTNNENLDGGVVINTVTWQHSTEGSCNQNNSNNAVHVGGHGIITLALNDTVGLYVENESAGHNITIRHANLTVIRVG